MRRFLQLSVLLALTTPGVLLIGPVTAAQAASGTTANPGLLQTAWFWQTAAEQANPPVPPPAPPPTEPSGVPKGDIAVAHTSNDATSSKMSVIAFAVPALKSGVTVSSFTFSLKVDGSGDATNFTASGAPIVACLPTRMWSPADGGDYSDQPPVNCADKVAAKVKDDTYTFSIPAVAQTWADDQNLGVALVNDPDNTRIPFQVAFVVKSIEATMTYSAPLPMPSTTGSGAAGGGSATGSTGSSGSAGGSGSSSAPVPSGPVDIPSSGPTTTTDAGPATPPVVAPTTAAPASAVHPLKAASSLPSGAFWVAAIAIALLIVVAGAVLADNAVPVPTATTSRLGRALRERERARQLQPSEPTATLAPQRG